MVFPGLGLGRLLFVPLQPPPQRTALQGPSWAWSSERARQTCSRRRLPWQPAPLLFCDPGERHGALPRLTQSSRWGKGNRGEGGAWSKVPGLVL